MKAIVIILLVLVSISVLGCTGKEKPVNTTAPVTTTVVTTPTGETLTYTFNVSDTNTMFDKNVTLVAFDIVDSYAILDIDGIRYDNISLGMDENIDGRIIKVFGVDDSNQTAEISVR